MQAVYLALQRACNHFRFWWPCSRCLTTLLVRLYGIMLRHLLGEGLTVPLFLYTCEVHKWHLSLRKVIGLVSILLKGILA